MPIYYGNANYRRKYEAFRVIDESGKNPLVEAIKVAMGLGGKDAFDAWIKVCEFVYAKPKFVEQTAEESVKNADAARETLRWMEDIASRAHGTEGERGNPSRMDGRELEISPPPTSAKSI